MKVVINAYYGGFGLSEDAEMYLICHGVSREEIYHDDDSFRANPILVECVEVLGDKANDSVSNLRVVEIPDGVDWYIEDYDGMESIHEQHRVWHY